MLLVQSNSKREENGNIIPEGVMMTTPAPDPRREIAPSKVIDQTCECSSKLSGTKGIDNSGISESMYAPASVSCAFGSFMSG
jgi:hypothetical protein